MLAADAAKVAIEIFHKHPEASPEAALEKIHAALRATRGAAAAVVRVNPEARTLNFAGLATSAASSCGTARVKILSRTTYSRASGSPRSAILLPVRPR